jgi:hypothetical protein
MIATAGLLTSCVQVPITAQMPAYIYQSATAPVSPKTGLRPYARTASVVSFDASTNAIDALYAQVTGQPASTTESYNLELSGRTAEIAQRQPLYPALAQTSLIRKFAIQLHAKAHGDDVESVPPPKVSIQEFQEFFKVFSTNFGNMFSDPERVQARLIKSPGSPHFEDVLVYYYEAYFDGKYVTRDGVALTKPGASLAFNNGQLVGSVNNDTITGMTTVFFEALLDYFVRVPLNPALNLATKPTGQTMPNPIVQTGSTNSADVNGLSTENWQIVNYASSASATGAQILTSTLVKSIGGTNLGFAVAYLKFSFGDNTTLTTMIDTALGLILKRDAEWTTFHLLKGDLKSKSGNVLPAEHNSSFGMQVWNLSSKKR